MHPKDAEGIANSVDPDQAASLGAVWSGSALFALTCLSENLGSLRYTLNLQHIYARDLWLSKLHTALENGSTVPAGQVRLSADVTLKIGIL